MKNSVWLLSGLGACWIGAALAATDTLLSQSSIGEAGVNALKLHNPPYRLTGRKIAIGQVEIGRPGQFGIDKAVSRNRAFSSVRVFFRNTPAKTNANVDAHAQNVASIMVGNAKGFRGVAPDARLYASAVGILKRNGQPEECLSSQHIAQQNGGDLRAINFSFGESLREDPRPQALLDGNALLTQCIDWSSRVHDVLYIVAGNQGKGGIPIPTDQFNGMTIAFSTRLKNTASSDPKLQKLGPYAKVDFANLGDPASGIPSRIIGLESNVGPRRSVSLLAPGNNVTVMNPDGRVVRTTGSSFAAPHVTASVALLQEFGDRQLKARKLNWSLDSRRHEVMKAILLNSAEKLQDQGNGLLLGMSRTILDKSNQDWLNSDAYRDRTIPLHIQMGAGQLNVFRAYQQFQAGQYDPSTNVPAIGWDYRTVGSNSNNPKAPVYREYVIDRMLQKGSHVAITLAWDRRVDLKDTNRNGAYDLGEEFSDRGLNNLDVYLMRLDQTDTASSVWSSVSEVDSVEHLFHPIPQTGRYKIRVVYQRQVNEPIQPYALAWWTVPIR
ncbi:MAG: S8 family serine peptidase [Leptolyngbyaceae cyanobacterium bins.59]|nr:S8 family serine peptidase [Leptolyngbyaceae cyanobacterium bins.59]